MNTWLLVINLICCLVGQEMTTKVLKTKASQWFNKYMCPSKGKNLRRYLCILLKLFHLFLHYLEILTKFSLRFLKVQLFLRSEINSKKYPVTQQTVDLGTEIC